MKINIRTIRFVVLLFLLGPTINAQTDSVRSFSTSCSVDLLSRYVWRGMDIGKGPSIQPELSASYKNFTIGAFGAYNFTGEGDQETDLYVSQTVGFVTLSVWDYWSFNDTSATDFFNYKKSSTSHLIEAQLLLSGGETLPFNILAACFFYGSDPSKSIYLELQYVPHIESAELMFFAGYQAKGSFYSEKNGLVNIGCTIEKEIPVTSRFNLPLNLSLVANPSNEKLWLVAGISF
jgi:hypothetical protein